MSTQEFVTRLVVQKAGAVAEKAKLRAILSEIELVGGDAEVDAAERLRAAAWALSAENSSGRAGERLQAALKEWNEAHEAFKAAARRSVQPKT